MNTTNNDWMKLYGIKDYLNCPFCNVTLPNTSPTVTYLELDKRKCDVINHTKFEYKAYQPVEVFIGRCSEGNANHPRIKK